MLTTGESFPTERGVADGVEATEMVGVEHLGQYVFEMTKAKVEAMKRGDDNSAQLVIEGVGDVEMENEEQPEEEELDEEIE